jgi:hypothetical protein
MPAQSGLCGHPTSRRPLPIPFNKNGSSRHQGVTGISFQAPSGRRSLKPASRCRGFYCRNVTTALNRSGFRFPVCDSIAAPIYPSVISGQVLLVLLSRFPWYEAGRRTFIPPSRFAGTSLLCRNHHLKLV